MTTPISSAGAVKPPAALSPLGRSGAAALDSAALVQSFAKAVQQHGAPMPHLALGKAAGAPMHGEGLTEAWREQDSLSAPLLPTAGGVPATGAAAPPPTSFVDPSAFADLLASLWMREQGRTTREVRVSFGASAWPATGATLVRNEDGTLSVAVSVGDRGTGDRQAGDLLKERLASRGLAVADVRFETV